MGQGAEDAGGYEIDYDPYEESMCDGLWTQKDHSQIHVSEMSTGHIRNAIRLCRNLTRTASFSCDSDKWAEWIEIFENELESRPTSSANRSIANPNKHKKAVRGSKVNKVCKCGKNFEARLADVKRGWGKYCSKSCKAKR